ncbi:MAG: hypothetical protein WCC57_13660, partial [Paracoccaceae bacterium]
MHFRLTLDLLPWGARAATVSMLALVTASPLGAENRPSLNFYGATGLIDMPSGEAQPDALLSTTTAHFGPISRTT